MTHAYKVRSVDLEQGTFVLEFDGCDPLNFIIPFNESGYLTGDELEAAIQLMYPWNNTHKETVKEFDGSHLVGRVEPMQVTTEQIRMQRDALLYRSDWTQVPDAPLTAEQVAAWATYRQALRDVTEQPGFPANVVWPVQPQ